MNVTGLGFGYESRRWAWIMPTVLLCAAVSVASAQCSQATRPEPAAPNQPAISSQAAASAESSPSTDTQRDVQFVTGSAVTVLEDTPLQVISESPISSRTTKPGARIPFSVTRDVVVNGILVIPCGARVYGTVVEAKQAGRLVGASNLTLQLTELLLDGKSYPLYTPPFKVTAASKTAPTMKKAGIGAGVGTLAGEASIPPPRTITWEDGSPHPHQEVQSITTAQRAEGDAIFASMGAGVGLAIAATSPPSIAILPAESQIEFTLASPIAVYPVDQRTAARLAQGMHHGGPVLYVRGENR